MEVNFVSLWHGCALYVDIKKFMEKNNFEQVWLNKKDFNGDVLFVNKTFLPSL